MKKKGKYYAGILVLNKKQYCARLKNNFISGPRMATIKSLHCTDFYQYFLYFFEGSNH